MILPKIKLVTEVNPDSDVDPEVIVSAEFPDGHQQCDLHFSLSDITVATEVMQFLASVLTDVKKINAVQAGACCDTKGYLGTTFLDGAGCGDRQEGQRWAEDHPRPETLVDPQTGVRYTQRRDTRASVRRAFPENLRTGWVETEESPAWGVGLPDGLAPSSDRPFQSIDEIQTAAQEALAEQQVPPSPEAPLAAEAVPPT